MKNYKLFFAALLILLIGIGLVILWQRSSMYKPVTREQNNLQSLSLVLDWTPNTNHTGFYVAQKMGWYKDEGISLKILPYSSAISPNVAVTSGKADVGISSTESIVDDAATGSPIVSIAAIIEHNTSALVARSDSGITRPRDLDGKIYGGYGAPFEEPVVDGMIRHDGGQGTFKNVTLNVDPMPALKSKQVDFVWIFMGWEGIAAKREKLGLNAFYVSKFGIPDYSTPNIISSKKTIQGKKDLLKRFMKATAKGFEYARLHPKESAKILINEAPKGTFPDPGLVYDSQEYLSPRYQDKGVVWGLQSKESWHDYPQFMLDHKAILDAKGKPITKLDFDSLYTNEFLNK